MNLEVGSGSGTEQTAQIMLKLEPILREKRADLLLVVGDVEPNACRRAGRRKTAGPSRSRRGRFAQQ